MATLDNSLRAIADADRDTASQSVVAQDAGRVPLCPGLTIVTAVSGPEGDYESIKTVVSADARGIAVTYSAQVPTPNGSLRNWNICRVMLHEDLGTATLYAHYFHSDGSDTIPGSTTLGVSTAVLRALKRTGTTEIGLVEGGNHMYPADRSKAPNLYDYEEAWKQRLVGKEPVRVTVNDAMASLPAIHARGSYLGAKVDFWFLDDEDNPRALASEQYNIELSSRRAAAVKASLITRFGIAGARLTTAGFGESSLRDRNDTLEGRARNRRVELVRR
jgi:hypothetical protein